MLQIISGKFFTTTQLIQHDAYAAIYSNARWNSSLTTQVGTLHPADTFSSIASHVLRYVNQIESDPDGRFRLVRTGDDVIVSQFEALLTVGIDAFFSTDKTAVDQVCRTAGNSQTDRILPSQYLHGRLDQNRFICGTRLEVCKNFIENSVLLPRNRYVSLVRACDTIRDAIVALSTSFELAYSMYVYAIESLAQSYHPYLPTWPDYDPKVKKSVDQFLAEKSVSEPDELRKILTESAHLKSKQRFVRFITERLGDDFFGEPNDPSNRWVRPSELEKSLSLAYQSRSSFVHELRPIRKVLRQTFASGGDIFYEKNKPYLTIAGLHRIALHVLIKFAGEGPRIETESLAWRDELPGIVKMNLGPQYWIGADAPVSKDFALSLYGGFLSQVKVCVGKGGSLTDLRSRLPHTLKLIQSLGPQNRERDAMLCMHNFYNTLVKDGGKSEGHDEVRAVYEDERTECSFPKLLIESMLTDDLPWTAAAAMSAFNEFAKQKFHKLGLHVDLELELIALAAIAKRAALDNDESTLALALKTGYAEATGDKDVRDIFRKAVARNCSVRPDGLMKADNKKN